MGPPLVPIWVSGFVALFRRPEWRPLRALAIAYPVVLVVTLVSGGQVYYPLGLLALLFAAGCVPTADWIARRPARRRPLVVAAVVLNAAVSAVIALPLIPVDVLGRTPIPDINQAARDSVGWPTYVGTVADVHRGPSAAERARAVVYTSNYGEAGAVDRYGPAYGLPAVYSAHNQLWFAGPPPETATVVVAWTQNLAGLSRYFGACEQRAVMDNGLGVDNEEQGSIVVVCRDPIGGGATVWRQLRHYS